MLGYPSDEVALAVTVTESVSEGETYRFEYRAKNDHGWGPWSDTLHLIAATVPNTANPVIISNEGTDIRISWTEPAYNGGNPLRGF